MRLVYKIGFAITAAIAAVTPMVALAAESKQPAACDSKTEICNVESSLELSAALTSLKAPAVPTPAWVNPPAVQSNANTARPITRTVTYSTKTLGNITADFALFKQLANQTLNDPRGWSNLGVRFTEVASGGDFTLILSEAAHLADYPGCGTEYSCNFGRDVIINQDRWEGATPSWNNAGGSLRDYRHMVVNHETGHWLGHSHANDPCSPGQVAPVMKQQSIDLQGCTFNAWPLASELSSSKLGIY